MRRLRKAREGQLLLAPRNTLGPPASSPHMVLPTQTEPELVVPGFVHSLPCRPLLTSHPVAWHRHSDEGL